MRIDVHDLTLQRNYLQKFRFLIKDYEAIKRGDHPEFRFVKDFYKHHDTDRRSFLKYYNRFKQSGKELDLLPQKRRIIKEKAGELGHIGSRHLPKSVIMGESRKLYIVAVIDSCTRIAWAEVVEDDLIRETNFESIEELKEELLQYMVYYNHQRPHQGLGGKTPVEFAENCPQIT